MKNYGFSYQMQLAHEEETDWRFGANSQKCRALVPPAARTACLPDGEVQQGIDDFMDCATRGPLNILETKFNYLLLQGALTPDEFRFLKQNGYIKNGKVTFSDRFIAVKSGTTRLGNSLKAPVDTIHRIGLIPKSMLPARSSMTWEQYHDPKSITPAMEALGLEFLKRFPINYERAYVEDIPEIIVTDMIGIAGFAWPEPVDGVYPKAIGPFNHVFVDFLTPQYVIFDNYIDSVDGDFIKQLAPDYMLMPYGYRVYIGTKLEDISSPLISQKLLSYILQLLKQGRPLEVLDILRRMSGRFFKRP